MYRFGGDVGLLCSDNGRLKPITAFYALIGCIFLFIIAALDALEGNMHSEGFHLIPWSAFKLNC